MTERKFIEGREACPFLPEVDELWTARMMSAHRDRYDVAFYEASLRYGQSLWLEGKPAQAMLQMNKALTADLHGVVEVPEDGAGDRSQWPLPYAAKVWVMVNAGSEEFLGNPVRHYQHLATRMSGPRPELRTWRAWACFRLAENLPGSPEFPRDGVQISREGVVVPEWGAVLEQVERLGLDGEGNLLLGEMAKLEAG